MNGRAHNNRDHSRFHGQPMIKPQNRGKFTKDASAHGESVQQRASQVLSAPKGKYSPALRKEANFARNFAH